MSENNRQRWWVVALVGVAGCSEDTPVLPENQPVQMAARLEAFESCAALETYIEDAAVLDMRSSLERSKPSYWGGTKGGAGGWYGGTPEASPMPPSAGDSASAPSHYTGTNNQVAGVDEADFVKNDGTRLFVLSGQKLYVHTSWPATSLRTESSLTVEGWPQQMFLRGNRVVIFSQVGAPQGGATDTPKALMDSASPCPPMGDCAYGGSAFTKVTTVDVSQLASPQVVSQLYLPGGYHDARLVGGSARVVLRESFNWPSGLRWYPDYNTSYEKDPERLERDIDALMVQNEQLIRARVLTDWLPEGRIRHADGSLSTWQRSCQDFHRTNAPTRLGFVTVASMDLDAAVAQAPGLLTLVAETDLLYSNGQSLYLSARHWWWWEQPGQQDYSYVHKLDLTQPNRATYVGSGTLEGQPLDQFSFDEHEGILRVATTLTRRVADNLLRSGRTETSSRVSTYALQDGQLQLVGKSAELAEGERIYSARFLGDKGYVVTFRQVDPLFTFDLSNPAHPHKVGELKVPGFSSYIHPLDATHLLTVGMDVPEDGNWMTRAVKLSLFDVSDLAHPREAFTQRVGTFSGYSESLYDHKAFNYFAAQGLLAIPFMDYSGGSSKGYWEGFTSDLRVFRVSPTTGFTSLGAVDVSDLFRTVNYSDWSYTYTPVVRRSVMADDYVYAISDAGVRVSHVSQLSRPLVTTRFDAPH